MKNTPKTALPLAALLLAAVASLPVAAGCSGRGKVNPSGTFEAVEVDLSPLLAGQVLRVGTDEGLQVEEGDTLLVVDTVLIRLQREEAVAGVAAVAARRQAAGNQRDEARRSLELAEITLERVTGMQKQGNATAQQLDEARTQRDIAAQKVKAAEHSLAALDAERQQLEAQIAVSDRKLHDGILLAPSAGTCLLRVAEPGEMAAPGALALRIADLDTLKLRFYLAEPDLGLVKLGRQLPVRVDALPDRSFNGRVSWISSEAEFTPKNAQTRQARAQLVYALEVRVPNPDGLLHIGMPAEVVLPERER